MIPDLSALDRAGAIPQSTEKEDTVDRGQLLWSAGKIALENSRYELVPLNSAFQLLESELTYGLKESCILFYGAETSPPALIRFCCSPLLPSLLFPLFFTALTF